MNATPALSNSTDTPAAGPALSEMIDLGSIHPSPTNPRKRFDEGDLAELAESIRKHGIIQPLVVRAPRSGTYELVAGERRWRAARVAGLVQVPAIVRDLSDEEVLEIQLVENLQRKDVHPLEEAHGYQQLMAHGKYDVARIAEKVGRSVKYVYDRVKLLSLIDEAQKLFLEDRITAGHAILLARLKPKDQERAIDPEDAAVWTDEQTLWNPDEDPDEASRRMWRGRLRKADPPEDPYEGLKPRSVRELQGWIDQHVKFDTGAEDLPDLFPETAVTLQEAKEVAEKILPITHEHFVRPDARDGQRVFGPRSWKRADGKHGSKTCDHSVTGVIVVGPARGDAYKVCVAKKKCTVHWGAEQRESAQRKKAVARSGKTGKDRWELEQEKRREQEKKDQELRARYLKARPAIAEALAKRVRELSPKATGLLADTLIREVESEPWGEALKWYKAQLAAVPRGTAAEDLVRHLVWIRILSGMASEWAIHREFPAHAKAFGVDILKLIDEHAPVQTSAEAKPVAGGAKKGAAKKKGSGEKKAAVKAPAKTVAGAGKKK